MLHPLHSVFPRNSNVGKAIAWWGAGLYAYRSGKKAQEFVNNRKQKKDKFSLTISSWDELELYTIFYKWLAENVEDNEELHHFDLITGYYHRDYRVMKVGSSKAQMDVQIQGVNVKIYMANEQTKEGNSTSTTLKRDFLIRCRSKEDLEVVSGFINALYRKAQGYDDEDTKPSEKKHPYRIWTGHQWMHKRFVGRAEESVVLQGSDREELFYDIQRFLDLKPEYIRTNIPWHRGYLFFGPPGTGKTSLGLAVASTFEMPVYFLSLTHLEGDKDLVKAITQMEHSEAVLILEDVDVTSATHERNIQGEGTGGKHVSLAGLLNILDGVDTPSGLVTIMTTNFFERLDKALIRPGRMDHKLYIGYLDDDQLERLLMWYLGIEAKDLPKIESEITPADITGIVKANMGHPDICLEEVKNFIREANEANGVRLNRSPVR